MSVLQQSENIDFLRLSLGQQQFFKLNNGGIIPEINRTFCC